MNTPEVIQHLERILVDSLAMLAAASEGRWDDLIALGTRRAESVEAAASLPVMTFNTRLQQHKSRLIAEIASTDERTRALVQTWMGELHGVLTSVQVERKLSQAYASL